MKMESFNSKVQTHILKIQQIIQKYATTTLEHKNEVQKSHQSNNKKGIEDEVMPNVQI